MPGPHQMIEATLADPGRLLGMVERNVEAKLIAPVLELLGWDLATQVLWGPQIRRLTEDGRRRDVEADVFVADIAAGQLRFLIEAKRWDRPLDLATIAQARGYLSDVDAQRALVTNGRRWIVVDAGIDEPLASHTAARDGTDAIIASLAPHLSPITAPSSPLPATKPLPAAVADLDELADQDPLIAELLAGLRAVVAEHSRVVYLEPGPKGLVLRTRRSGNVILPLNAADPLRLELYRDELQSHGVSSAALDSYAGALRAVSAKRTSEAVAEFIAKLADVVTNADAD